MGLGRLQAREKAWDANVANRLRGRRWKACATRSNLNANHDTLLCAFERNYVSAGLSRKSIGREEKWKPGNELQQLRIFALAAPIT
jgi:hypothetical protein